jgi:hypothetical protein
MGRELTHQHRLPPRPGERRIDRPPPGPGPRLGPAAVLALQRSAGNQAVQRALLRQPATAVDPWPAIKAIDAWRVKADALLDGTTAWQTANWIEFLGRTSSDPILSLADSDLAGIMSNACGNFLTGVGEEAIKKGSAMTAGALGAAIGTEAAPVVGTVIGFVVGVLIESAASYVFENITGKRDAGETAAEAAARVTHFIQLQHALLSEQHAKAAGELETLVAAMRDQAEQAQTQGDVDEIAKWAVKAAADTQPPAQLGPPYPLAAELLRVWALEHAGDLSSARPGTEPAQFDSAVADTLNGLEAQPSLFVYQTRAEWERAGLDHQVESAALLSDVDALVAEVGTPLVGTTAKPGVVGAADAVQRAYQDKEFEFTSFRDVESLRSYIVGHNDRTAVDKDWLLEKLQAGKVRVYCGLDVHSASESAYIDEWNWRLEIDVEPGENPDPGPGGAGGSAPAMDSGVPSDTLHVTFDVWPTWG